VVIKGLDQTLEYLMRVASGKVHRDALDAVGSAMVDVTVNRFATETEPSGKAWPKSQRALEQGGQTLSDNAILRRSFRHLVISSDAVKYGTPVFYAVTHQEGRTIEVQRAKALRWTRGGAAVFAKRVVIPQRRILPEAEEPDEYQRAARNAVGKVLLKGVP
jgi:phage gpG-like protein